MSLQLAPTILTYSKKDFYNVLMNSKLLGFNFFHIDIIDSSYSDPTWFDAKMFFDSPATKKFVFHLMVEDVEEFLDVNEYFISKDEDVRFLINLTNYKNLLDRNSRFLEVANFDLVIEQKELDDEVPLEILKMVREVCFMPIFPGLNGAEIQIRTFDYIDKFRLDFKKIIEDRKIFISTDGAFNEKTAKLYEDIDLVYSGSYLKDKKKDQILLDMKLNDYKDISFI